MRRVIGFAMFCIVIGMLIVIFFPYTLLEIFLIALFLILGYRLFCC